MDLAAMVGAPDDPAWIVWADQLLARGDPRGELIALERVPQSERNAAQSERLTVLYQRHTGRVEGLLRALLPGGWLRRAVMCWRFGYALDLRLMASLPAPEPPSYSALFGADELRFVSSLSLDLWEVEPFLDALERHRPPLVELTLFGAVTLDDCDCARLWAALPALQSLSFSRSVKLAHINHPGLSEISAHGGPAAAPPDIELVARSELPALVRLKYTDIPLQADSLDRMLQGQGVPSLLERLEVFEYPHLFAFWPDDDTEPAWDGLDAAARLPRSLRIVAIAKPQIATAIREHLPEFDFGFVESLEQKYAWRRSERDERLVMVWPCGQPSLELVSGMYLMTFVPYVWKEMDAEQQHAAWELIGALDASERGQDIEFELEALLRVVQSMLHQPIGNHIHAANIAALEQHRACCPKVILRVEARSKKA